MLVKYKSDLSRPFHEASSFLNSIQLQLSDLCAGASTRTPSSQSLSLSINNCFFSHSISTYFYSLFRLHPFFLPTLFCLYLNPKLNTNLRFIKLTCNFYFSPKQPPLCFPNPTHTVNPFDLPKKKEKKKINKTRKNNNTVSWG